MQVEALKKTGCAKVHTEVTGCARGDRPVLVKLLQNLRAGDVLLIWKLERLGRSLQRLVDLSADAAHPDFNFSSA
jgi:DNA invertase Pin-like site-specific DNA recombinase